MNFEIYCDEALPDLFTSEKPRSRFLMIGGLWMPADLRSEIKDKIKTLRAEHNAWGEIKWTKVSPSKLPFYESLIDLFMGYGMDMRFRCIAVDHEQVNMALHGNDGELGFYKFYYQLLHHWILDFNSYRIFCDTKTNRDPDRLKVLQRCLGYANMSSAITDIQALPSRQTAPIQLCDLLLGVASSRINETLREGSAKHTLVSRLEGHLNVATLGSTRRTEEKFNIFKIKLGGGW